jgi:hypothetical protein
MTDGSLAGLPHGPISTIEGAITRMNDISAALPTADGLACFNRMYLIVTEKVQSEVSIGATFADPAFMSRMDVVFVNLYLAAIDSFRAQPPNAPRCWSELFDRRSDAGITPMQFALAGMNAHINHDLPIAVVQTCTELGTAPEDGQHDADFDAMNTTLGNLDQQVRESFESGVVLELDRRTADVENLFGSVGIDADRTAAWVNAIALWRLRHDHWLTKEYIDGLDVAAALVARAVLQRLP